MNEALARTILHYAELHADAEGLARLPIDGVAVMRASAPGAIQHAVYRPLVCLVLQGAKEITMLADRVAAGSDARTLRFAAGQSLVLAVDLPVASQIVQASPRAPYLAIAAEIDMRLMHELAAGMEPPRTGRVTRADPGPRIDDTDAAILDCAARLMDIIERPEAVRLLGAGILRELHFWLLAGRHGATIRRLARPDGQASRIARAVALLRAEFTGRVTVERLAACASMSPSSFHQHFKTVTSLTPIQFQKRLRLIEARRLMIADGIRAGDAAFAVGYESVSQFTRDYARLFGAPPRRDLTRASEATSRAA